jgi:hypothetical protein
VNQNDNMDDEYFDGEDDKINNPDASERNDKRKKSRSPHYEGNDKGGYGNPPVKDQFLRGNGGGPGRPKGVTNLEGAMRKVTGTRMTVNKKGRPTKMMPVEIFAERTMEAILGKTTSPRMLEFGHNLLDKYGPQEPSEEGMPDYSVLSHDELSILGGLFAKTLGEAATFPDPSPLGEKYTYKIESEYRVFRRDDGHIVVERLITNEDNF